MSDKAYQASQNLLDWIWQQDITQEEVLLVLLAVLTALIKASPAPKAFAKAVISAIKGEIE